MVYYLVDATLLGDCNITWYILHYLGDVTLPGGQEEEPGSVVVRGVELVDQLLSLLS